MLALLSAGPINDHAVRILSKRNKGVFEAEMRLVLVMPCGICFAIGEHEVDVAWIVPMLTQNRGKCRRIWYGLYHPTWGTLPRHRRGKLLRRVRYSSLDHCSSSSIQFLAFLVAGAAFGTICGITYASSAFPARGGDTFGIIM